MGASRLAQIEREIEAIKARIAALGVVRPGSLTRQFRDPRRRRGAYYQLSYTHRRQSQTRYVRPDALAEVRRQIRDYRTLRRLVERWIALGIEYSALSMRQRPP